MLNQEFWKKYFKEYDNLNLLIPYQDLLNTIIQKIELENNEKILDAGSGTGNLSIKLKAMGADVWSLDYATEGLDIHKSKDPNATLIHQNLTEALPFVDGFFDGICSNNTIYTISVEKREKVFKEFYRVLKPGGKIVISNIKTGFNPTKIYSEHVKKYFLAHGLFFTLSTIINLLGPTLKIFYYNFLINKENKYGSYSFFKNGEQKELLKKTGFKDITDDIIVYANQAILNKAKK